jgi:GLPGLI family protein
MKKLTIVLFLLTGFTLNSFSQNYIAKYQYFAFPGRDSVLLTFNAIEWLYNEYYTPVWETKSENTEALETLQKTPSPQQTFFTFHSLKKNEYLKEERVLGIGRFAVKAPMSRLEWTISPDSTKTMGNYQCLTASANLCGVPIQAWFAPEIPVTCGPDRFWGLPGLIVSIKSADGKLYLELLSLSKTEIAPAKPQIENTVSKEQYWKIEKEGTEKLIRQIQSMGGENSKITISIPATTEQQKCLME